MTLQEAIKADNEFLPVGPREVIRYRLNSDNSMGRGRNAKRRAGDIVQSMLWRNDFGAQFDTLVRYSGGLNSTTY